MNGLTFFDTNVLVYTDDASSPEKRDRAIALFAEHLRHGTAVLSLQVLPEYFTSGNAQARVGARDGTAEG
jgi:predicted nucleic acid-binding protein